ncbi:MAG TPA: hypothetical protein VFA20_11955 [Myxococcaceae bacterium]|nr:hypothetical protein [Myxococcaceae bacterium]
MRAASNPISDRYEIDLPLQVRVALSRLSPEARNAVLRRLAEIAYAAASLTAWMPDTGDMRSAMHFEVGGVAISYAMSDARRSIQVLGVAQLTESGRYGKFDPEKDGTGRR